MTQEKPRFEVLDVKWFCGRSNIGIVKVNNYGEICYFIGSCSGLDEQSDMEEIAQYGSTFPSYAGRILFGDNKLVEE